MRTKSLAWLSAVAVLAAFPAFGDPHPVGSDFRVNGNTVSKQRNPVAAMAPSGRSLVVWENDKLGLRGRFFNRDGSPASGELPLVANQKLPGVPAEGIEILRKDAALAFMPNGEFLLSWTEEMAHVKTDIFIEQRDVLDRDVFVQRFSAAGVAAAAPSRVNGPGTGFQSQPKILLRNNGAAVVVWQSDDLLSSSQAGDGIFGHLVTKATGRPFGDDFRVSTPAGVAGNAAIAALPNGDFMVAWEAADADSLGVYVRAFPRDFANPGTDTTGYQQSRINEATAGLQRRPALVPDGGSEYVVVWQAQGATVKAAHIVGRSASQFGAGLGHTYQVSQGVGPTQISPSIARVKGGNFLVTWLDWKDVFPIGVYGTEIDDQGHSRSAEVRINDQAIGAFFRTSIAGDENSVLIPWEGYINRLQGISARRVDP